MNQPKTSKAEATKRPWHRHDTEHDSICGPDHKAIALVMGRSRSKYEDAANLSLIVQAVNEYDGLIQERHDIHIPLANAVCNELNKYGENNFDRVRNAKKYLEALNAVAEAAKKLQAHATVERWIQEPHELTLALSALATLRAKEAQ